MGEDISSLLKSIGTFRAWMGKLSQAVRGLL